MKTTKSKIIASVTALVLLFGVFFMVRAMQKNTNETPGTLTSPDWQYMNSSTESNSTKAPNTLVNQDWYFVGTPSDSHTDATKYSAAPDPELPCGGPKEEVCRISAPNDGTGKPNMSAIVTGSQTVAQRINAAFSGSTPAENETVLNFREEGE